MKPRARDHLMGLLILCCIGGMVACASMDCSCHTVGGLFLECRFPVQPDA